MTVSLPETRGGGEEVDETKYQPVKTPKFLREEKFLDLQTTRTRWVKTEDT